MHTVVYAKEEIPSENSAVQSSSEQTYTLSLNITDETPSHEMDRSVESSSSSARPAVPIARATSRRKRSISFKCADAEELPYFGKKRKSDGFKKWNSDSKRVLERATFRCGLSKADGSVCEHRIGLFFSPEDAVAQLPTGEFTYNGRALGWGNTVPAVDRRTQGKLAQTWRLHFESKHGWARYDSRLPLDCQVKSIALDCQMKSNALDCQVKSNAVEIIVRDES